MFSTLPSLPHSIFQGRLYASQISSPLSSSSLHSSPLSPRDGNIPTRQLSMSSPTPMNKTQRDTFSKRVAKANPLIHNRSDGREARRNLYFKKVRQSSEDRRWESRGGDEEMMRTIWVAEEKRRVEQQLLDAAHVPSTREEEEPERDHDEGDVPSMSQDEEMADEVAQQEDAELDAYFATMEADLSHYPPDPHESSDTSYGSDDEGYDTLLMDIVIAADKVQVGGEETQAICEKHEAEVDTAMDMS